MLTPALRFESVQLGPLTILRCREQEFLDGLKRIIHDADGCVITYSHLHTLALVRKNDRIACAIRSCDLCYCDGIGVSLISLILKGIWIPKVTANSFIHQFVGTIGSLQKKVALVGGPGDTLQDVSDYFVRKGASVVYTHHGFLDDLSREKLSASLTEIQPDIVIISMGQSSQEELALFLSETMPSVTFLCVGALFEFLSGSVWLCPQFLRQVGLEWVVRLFSDPKRLWRRYLLEGPSLLLRATVLRRL